MSETFAVIMAGGSGTRFWPASRKLNPKQLLAIGPDSEHSLLAKTVQRIESFCSPEQTLIATGAHLLQATRRAVPGLPETSLLGEPVARNTSACIAWSTAIAARRSSPDALVMVLPSDQHIGDEAAFKQAIQKALDTAASGHITTIGIQPTRPETGYGYIEAGEGDGNVRAVARFVEKPDRATAERYLADGSYFWNSGMFFFRATDMLTAIKEHLPEIHQGLQAIEAAAGESTAREREVTQTVFHEWPSISIDYGVMEKQKGLRVVPASCGWSDLGSWESAWELSDKDDDDNAVGSALVHDAHRNLVRDLRTDGMERTIALVGVDDLCVVETDDALLVIRRDRAQDVRAIVDQLKKSGRDDRI